MRGRGRSLRPEDFSVIAAGRSDSADWSPVSSAQGYPWTARNRLAIWCDNLRAVFSCVALSLIVVKLLGMSSIMSFQNWLSCDEASDIIGCTADHVRFLARQGQLQAQKFGERTWLIDKESAEKVANETPKTGRPRKNDK